jgi:ATP-dependent Clp protease ATP-binding subunit ClpB
MNIQKFTQKSLEALQEAQNITIENQNAQIEEEHLLLALLKQDDSLIKELFKKINQNENVEKELESIISKRPRMTGGARPKERILCFTRCRHSFSKIRKNCKRYE